MNDLFPSKHYLDSIQQIIKGIANGNRDEKAIGVLIEEQQKKNPFQPYHRLLFQS